LKLLPASGRPADDSAARSSRARGPALRRGGR